MKLLTTKIGVLAVACSLCSGFAASANALPTDPNCQAYTFWHFGNPFVEPNGPMSLAHSNYLNGYWYVLYYAGVQGGYHTWTIGQWGTNSGYNCMGKSITVLSNGDIQFHEVHVDDVDLYADEDWTPGWLAFTLTKVGEGTYQARTGATLLQIDP